MNLTHSRVIVFAVIGLVHLGLDMGIVHASDWKPLKGSELEGGIALVKSESRVGEGMFLHCKNTVKDKDGEISTNEERALFKVEGKGAWCNDKGRGSTPRYEYAYVPIAGKAAPVKWQCDPADAGIFQTYPGDDLKAIFIPSGKHRQRILIGAEVAGEPSPPDEVKDTRTKLFEWEADDPNNHLTTFTVGIRILAVGLNGVACWTAEDGGKDVSEFDDDFSRDVLSQNFHAALVKTAETWDPPWKVDPADSNFAPEYNTFYDVYYARSSNNIHYHTCTGTITSTIGFKVSGPQVFCQAHTSARWFWKGSIHVLTRVGPRLVAAAEIATGPYGAVVSAGANMVIDFCIEYAQKAARGLSARAAFYAVTEIAGMKREVKVDVKRSAKEPGEDRRFSASNLTQGLTMARTLTGPPQYISKSSLGAECGVAILSDGHRDGAHAFVCAAKDGRVISTLDRIDMKATKTVTTPFYTRPVTHADLRP